MLKELWNKDLLYEGHKVMPYCPRCGTALSSHEVAQGYKDVKDLTCIAKFKLEDGQDFDKDTYILAWTTTPWTLPSNLALCVNKTYTYVLVKANIGDEDAPKYENYILAKDLLDAVLKETPYEIEKEFKGEELLGTKYEQLMPFAKVDGKAFYTIEVDSLSNAANALNTKIEEIDEHNFKIQIEKEEIPKIVKTLVKENIQIYKICEDQTSLEDAFLKKTGGNIIE